MKKIIALFCTGIVALAACPGLLTAATSVERVGVSAEADEQYLQSRKTAEGLREETYVFAKGQFFPGETTEPSLRAIKFDQLVEPLAHGLAEQNYFPAPDQASADLLITVHWGVTNPATFDDLYEEDMLDRTQDALANQNPDPALIDYGRLNELSAMQENISSGMDRTALQNARLLGYLPTLLEERENQAKRGQGSAPTPTAKQMGQERYFIVLMAWDNQLMQNEGERQLRWVVRCNLPAMGNRFAEAVPALIRVGSQYYGHDLQAPRTERTHLGPGRVQLADPEIIGVEE